MIGVMILHGVPGGHEFTSFVLGLYNASGKGQPFKDNKGKDTGEEGFARRFPKHNKE